MQHACMGCGGSCSGVKVRLFPEEESRIQTFGLELGRGEVIEQGMLRQLGGQCVFLEAGKCWIHKHYGPEAKPMICRQYPLVRARVGSELREGIDPGCYRHAKTWRGESQVDRGEDRLVMPRPGADPAERALVGVLVGSVGEAIGRLVGERAERGIPVGFARRLHGRLAGFDWDRLLGSTDAGPALREALGPVKDWARGPDIGIWQVSEEDEAYGLDVARRVVVLQLYGEAIPGPFPAALLTLAGALAVGLAAPDRFGEALAGWTRALRAPGFRAALIPNARALQELVSLSSF